jgi:L-alanine-DL-glutamate epimerase-like enolase superfamily enzyme
MNRMIWKSSCICRVATGTTGLVEITLDNGVVGLGEGYLAVFAPRVFEQIVKLVTPALLEQDPQDYARLYRDVSRVTGYWSLQGAAQHVVSAVEIALQDCGALNPRCTGLADAGRGRRVGP